MVEDGSVRFSLNALTDHPGFSIRVVNKIYQINSIFACAFFGQVLYTTD